MRKFIYKKEIESCFVKENINESDQFILLKSLFINPIDSTKQFILKESVCDINTVLELCKAVLKGKETTIADICSLFAVDDDLHLPLELRVQISNKENIAFFVGAGVSKILGIPLWNELANQAIEYLHNKSIITFDEAEKINRTIPSPKQRLSIFRNMLGIKKEKLFYNTCLRKPEFPDVLNPYDLLVKVGFPVFSSNLDNELFYAFTKKLGLEGKVAKRIDMGFYKEMKIENDAIYQIHGSLENMDKYSIITMSDYIKYYYNDPSGNLQNFLNRIFNEYSVIFLGYGMEEFEILQNIIKSGKKHHVVIETYLNDTSLLRIKKKYFENIEVKAHGYYLDFEGYRRLYKIIESWSREINQILKFKMYDVTGEFKDVKF